MKSETKTCQNCKKDFIIEPDDFSFYEKIKVPPPTFCPECRQQRRLAWRNERVLYKRNCDLCKKSAVTIYSPNKPCKVYCLSCWWSDKWDPASYGKDYNFSRPFFEQYREFQEQVPRMALLNKNNINSEYTNHSADNKNAYLSFVTFYTEDIFYSTWVMNSRNCIDCSFVIERNEKLYQCIDSRKSYQCQYGILLKDCISCYYCYDCHGCTNCFMSSNLRNKSYIFRNKQHTREGYFEKIKEYNLSSYKVREQLKKDFLGLLKNNSIHRYIVSERNINSTGNMLFNCKNAKNSFDVDNVEDSRYIYSVSKIKNAMDIYNVGFNTELVYESHGCARMYNCQFCHLCYDNSHLIYCDSCQNSQNLFGCISIKKGEYMIFNKKYSKEEYNKLKNKIIEHMKKTGEYGEFFPPSISPVAYNETQGNYYMPLNKEEVLNRGWLWEDKVPGTFGKETMLSKKIPDTIEEIKKDMFSAILKCIECGKNYNIVPDELTFYQKETIPLPRSCPDCRYKWRFNLRLPRKLWHRQCMCGLVDSPQATIDHGHQGQCPIEFETSYSPQRKEIIYCEKCYQGEVY